MFVKVGESIIVSFLYFFVLHLHHNKDCIILPFSALNPNWMSSSTTFFLIFVLNSCSVTLIPCSGGFTAMKKLHSVWSSFCLNTDNSALYCHQIMYHKSVNFSAPCFFLRKFFFVVFSAFKSHQF